MWGEGVADGGEGRGEAVDGSGSGLAEEMFEFGEDLFDRVEVQRIGRQEQQMRARPTKAERTARPL